MLDAWSAANAAVVVAFAAVVMAPATVAAAPPSVSPVPRVDLTCAPQELDLNHASQASLMNGLEIDRPIAERLMAARPHYDLHDALVTAGLGPGRIARLASTVRTCATPMMLPPALPPDVCSTSTPADLQLAGVELLTQMFASRPAAERVIAWRAVHPFPDVHHALIVAGISAGKVKKILPELCVTPAPFNAFDQAERPVDYRWLYPQEGGLVVSSTDADYRLSVPVNAVTEELGAWGSVTILPPESPDLVYPRADMHIDGSWEGAVGVRLPRDRFGHVSSFPTEQVLWHKLPDGSFDRMSGPMVTVDATTVSGEVTSLSELGTIITVIYNGVIDAARWARGTFVAAPGCGHSAGVAVEGAPVDSLLAGGPALKWCATSTAGEGTARGDVTLRNAYRLMLDIVLSVGNSPTLGSSSVANRYGGDLFPEIVARIANTSAPEGEYGVAVNTPAAIVRDERVVWPEGFASLQVDPNVAASVAALALELAGEAFADAFDDVVEELRHAHPLLVDAADALDEAYETGIIDAAECFWEAKDIFSESTAQEIAADLRMIASSCFGDMNDVWKAAIDAAKARAAQLGLSSPLLDRLLGSVLRSAVDLKRVDRVINHPVLQVGDVIREGLVLYRLASRVVNITVRPARPTTDPTTGKPIYGSCLQELDDRFVLDRNCQSAKYSQPDVGGPGTGLEEGHLVRNASGDVWLLTKADGVYHPVDDGGTYECLAWHYWVDWGADVAVSNPGSDAVCPGPHVAPLRDKYLHPDKMLLTVSIMRQGDGTAWYAWNGSERMHIPTGTEFNCWVDPAQGSGVLEAHVWDLVTTSELERFPRTPEGTFASNCPGGF